MYKKRNEWHCSLHHKQLRLSMRASTENAYEVIRNSVTVIIPQLVEVDADLWGETPWKKLLQKVQLNRELRSQNQLRTLSSG